uniref:Uncharacterized protein n=1 Tax=Cacopsylla melanoneura TaxID=428564 RepID=A0A8D8PVL2_9HEMI
MLFLQLFRPLRGQSLGGEGGGGGIIKKIFEISAIVGLPVVPSYTAIKLGWRPMCESCVTISDSVRRRAFNSAISSPSFHSRHTYFGKIFFSFFWIKVQFGKFRVEKMSNFV